MAKDDIWPIRGLVEHTAAVAGADVAARAMPDHEAMAEASAEELASWLAQSIDRLEDLVGPGACRDILGRMGCDCFRIHPEHMAGILERRAEFDSLDVYIDAVIRDPFTGSRMERRGDEAYSIYRPDEYGLRCYCSLWRGLAEGQSAPLTWCECARELVAEMWERLVGRPVRVEVEGSCIAGDGECRFAIHLGEIS